MSATLQAVGLISVIFSMKYVPWDVLDEKSSMLSPHFIDPRWTLMVLIVYLSILFVPNSAEEDECKCKSFPIQQTGKTSQ